MFVQSNLDKILQVLSTISCKILFHGGFHFESRNPTMRLQDLARNCEKKLSKNFDLCRLSSDPPFAVHAFSSVLPVH